MVQTFIYIYKEGNKTKIMIDYIDNYKMLCGAIVFEQCVEYAEIYSKWLKSPNKGKKWRDDRVKYARYKIESGWCDYLNIDMTSILNSIEERLNNGEKITWKKRETFSLMQ